MKSLQLFSNVALMLLVFTSHISGQTFPAPVHPPRLINDFASILNIDEIDALEIKLMSYYEKTSTQLVIVTISNLGGMDPNQFADGLSKQWGVGNQGTEKAAVILVKPKNSYGPLRMALEPNQHLKEQLSKRVQKSLIKDISPRLKREQYYTAFGMASDEIITLLSRGNSDKGSSDVKLPFNLRPLTLFLILIVILLIIRSMWLARR